MPAASMAWSLLFALAGLSALAIAAITMVLRAGGRKEETVTSNDARGVSRFTIPVSVIVPIDPLGLDASRAIAALLDLHYPALEVIAVVNGKTAAGALATLRSEWQLDAHEFFFRKSIATTAVSRIYRSRRDERVTVIDLPVAGRADAINAAVNIARYRYVATVDPELRFDRQALLRVMAAPLRDPSTILGASAHVEREQLFARVRTGRSLAASLLFWRHLPCAPPPADAVCVWRRDAVLEAGGFSGLAADPDLDMTARVLLGRADSGSGRFYRSGELFGTSAGPTRRPLSRVIAAAQFLRVLTPAGVRAFGGAALATFFALELVAPLAQLWVVAGVGLGVATGAWSWSLCLLAIAVVIVGRAAVTTAALLTRGSALKPPEGAALRALLAAAPLEWLGMGVSNGRSRSS